MSETAFRKIAENIVRTAQSQSENIQNEMLFGTVITVNPLSIQLDNFNTPLPAQFFWVGNWCKPVKITIPHTHLLGFIDMGNHVHPGTTDPANRHNHYYTNTTKDAGRHTHIQQAHEHPFSAGETSGTTGSVAAINNEIPDHNHDYEGYTEDIPEHVHTFTTDEANVRARLYMTRLRRLRRKCRSRT